MTKSKLRADILNREWSHCLGLSRDARYLVLRDSESFHEAATNLEQIGQIIGGRLRIGLGAYRHTLLDITQITGRHERNQMSRLLKVVCEARNMAVHEGAWARHLSDRLVDFFLILEEAIMNVKQIQIVADIMVRSPVFVEPWHTVSHVRRQMLANSFSCLPILYDGKWNLISDVEIMKLIRKPSLLKDYNEIQNEKLQRLSMKLDAGLKDRSIVPTLAKCCSPYDTIPELLEKMDSFPILVIEENDGEKRLWGIVTPFDLL